MKGIFISWLVFGALLMPGAVRAADSASFVGHYERTDATDGVFFSLDVSPSGKGMKVSFSAGHADGSGAAPDGGGDGAVDGTNVLKFKFQDSFDDEGTGTLARRGKSYVLTLDVSRVQDSRAAALYGTFSLKKTSSKPSPD